MIQATAYLEFRSLPDQKTNSIDTINLQLQTTANGTQLAI